jgi:hypothetical protein
VGLDRGTFSLVSAIEELFQRKSRGSGTEIRDYGCRDPSRWPRGTLYTQKVDTNFTNKGLSLGRYSSLADSGHGAFYTKSFMCLPFSFCYVFLAGSRVLPPTVMRANTRIRTLTAEVGANWTMMTGYKQQQSSHTLATVVTSA